MDSIELREALIDLARDVKLEVRRIEPAASLETATTSAVCRVRGRVWIVLSSSDPLDVQIEVLVNALRTHARDAIEGRYLPPALREQLDR